MNQGNIYPLFSKVFYTKVIELDLKKSISAVDKICDTNWINSGHKKDYAYDIKKPSLTSKEKQLLKKPKLKFLKNKILEEFYIFTKEVLKYEQKFDFSTSWSVVSEPGAETNFHSHANSMFSGILYLHVDENSGDIAFQDYTDIRYLLDKKEFNIYNSRSWRFKPVDGLLIIFPSEMHHKVLKNESHIMRKSIAFNLYPIGDIYQKDSGAYLHLK